MSTTLCEVKDLILDAIAKREPVHIPNRDEEIIIPSANINYVHVTDGNVQIFLLGGEHISINPPVKSSEVHLHTDYVI